MKNLLKIFTLVLATLAIGVSCQKEHELGELIDKSQIDFDVIQDFDNSPGGNKVILRNNTPGTISMWDYGTGRSTRAADTICISFKGTYVIKFSAVTAGGIVEMDPVTIEVTDDDLSCVEDPLWTKLSGGVGNEKTWLLDLDADGNSKYFTSPIYFSGMDWGWGDSCQVAGGDCWNWFPSWKGNEWIAPAADYGTMKFNLIGGPFVTVDQQATSNAGTTSGTYFLDSKAKTITFTDVIPLNRSEDHIFSKGYIVSLTEDALQIAFKHAAKEEFEIFNYISQEYNDNWVPEDLPDPNFDHGDQEEILAITPTKTWKFDLEVPYNWTDLEGVFLNNWSSRADIVATGWAPYGDGDVGNIDDVTIEFSQDGKVIITQDDGSTEEGNYELDEASNMITFSDIVPNILIADWVSAATTSENKWKIVIVERDILTNEATGIWLGRRDESGKSEYMVFHFVLE